MSYSGSFAQMQEFDDANEDFDVYSEKLEQYFVVKGYKDDDSRRTAVLITGLSSKVYKLLRDLCFPAKPKDKGYIELVELLSEQLIKKRSILAERYKFHRAKQGETESVQEWSARLKRLSTHCGFAAMWDVFLRDRFVVGLADEDILDRLFGEPDSLTFVKAEEIAIQLEAAKSHIGEIKKEANAKNVYKLESKNGTSQYRNSHHATGSREQKPRRKGTFMAASGTKDGRQIMCRACGGAGHIARNCKYVVYKCRDCGTVGHLAKVCTVKKAANVAQGKCYWNASEVETEVINNAQMYHLQGGGTGPFTIEVCFDSTPLLMEIDSGSGVSTISLEQYNKLFNSKALKKSNVVLVGYTQAVDRPVGMFKTEVSYMGKKECNYIHVVKNGGPPLFGRDLMRVFKIECTQVHSLRATDGSGLIINEFDELFKEGLGTYKYGEVSLKLKPNADPIFMKPRVLPFIFRELVEKELERLTNEGTITPVEVSKWGTPLVPILKKDGTVRLCADYKVTLNKYLEVVNYPMPRIEELFTRLEGGEEFTKLDLSQAYNQLVLDEESSRVATWSTHKGLFKVNRLPYGVSPAAAVFQRMIEQLLQGLSGVVSFLDDIVVTGKSREEHVARLKEVLKRLLDAGLRLRKEKCKFFMKEVNYLGHIISSQGLWKDRDKVKAIIEAEKPTTAAQLRSFVGMVSYYGRFVPKMSTVMGPLYQLLGKEVKFVWSEQCQEAFIRVKELICSDQVLAHYNPDLPIRLTCDASMEGIGAVLAHVDKEGKDKPIAYAARTLSKAERNYPMVEKEALAIYFGVKHFHQYVYGREFILVTDHQPLLTLFGENKGIPTMAASRLQRWALFLSGYRYHIQGIKGRDNVGADYLSRLQSRISQEDTEEMELGSYLHFIESKLEHPIDSKKVCAETRRDPVLSRVYEYINTGWPNKVEESIQPYRVKMNELTNEQGCVMWGYRVVIPAAAQSAMLEELHASHMGIVKMKSVARSFMWWPGVDREIEALSKSCSACATNKPEPNKAILLPWARPREPWQRLHADYLGPVQGKMYLIVVDAYSKWPEVVGVSVASSEQTTLRLRDMFARFGLPSQMVTDNGTQFTSAVFREFLKKNGIRQTLTAPGHPATNGLAENGVKSFKAGLYKALTDVRNQGVDIQTLIARYLLNYRNAAHSTTLESPAKLLLGRQLRVRLSLIKPSTEATIEHKQEKQIEQFNGKRNVHLGEGRSVLVRDYTNVNRKEWRKGKIEKRLGPRGYLCRLPDGRCWRRHLNQIIEFNDQTEEAEVRESENATEKVIGIKDEVTELQREEPARTGEGVTVGKLRPQRKVKPPDRYNW